MICYFRKGLKPSIKVKMEQQDQKSKNIEEMVQRAVNAKAKAGRRSSTMVRISDAHCPRGYYSSHNTFSKVQIQGSKNSSRSKEPKLKDLKSAPSRDDAAEPAKKKDRKDTKKRFLNQRREHTRKQTLTTGVNTKAPKKKIKAKCFNCNKKSHYANNCNKPPKN